MMTRMPMEYFMLALGLIIGFHMPRNIGANDMANPIGPLALIFFLTQTGEVGAQAPVPFCLLLFGGAGIATGIATGASG